MIENVKAGNEYYMSWADKLGIKAGLLKVRITRALNNPNRGFYEMEVLDFFYTDEDHPMRLGMAHETNLFSTFKEAFKDFRKQTGYTYQDMIVNAFHIDGAFTRSKMKVKVKA